MKTIPVATSRNALSNLDPPMDYPALFVANIQRSMIATLKRARQESGALLAEETHTRALHVLTYALKLSDIWPLTLDLLLTLTPKLEQAGFREEWLPYLESGLNLSERCNDLPAGAEIRLHMGHLRRLQGHFGQAWSLLDDSAVAFATLGNQTGHVRALNQLAYAAWQQHHYDEAERLAKTALAMLNEMGLERAMSLSALGLVAIERQHWDEAETYHRAALQIRMHHHDRRQTAWSLQNLGYALRGQGQYKTAISYFEEARTILTELGDLANCAIVQMNLGIVCSIQHQPNKALEWYALAEGAFRRIGDEWNLAKTLVNQGIEYLAIGDWQQAENTLASGAALFDRLADLNGYLNARYELGVCYLEQNLCEKARTIFETVAAELPQIEGSYYHRMLKPSVEAKIRETKQRSS